VASDAVDVEGVDEALTVEVCERVGAVCLGTETVGPVVGVASVTADVEGV